jgi:hypothetical protein
VKISRFEYQIVPMDGGLAPVDGSMLASCRAVVDGEMFQSQNILLPDEQLPFETQIEFYIRQMTAQLHEALREKSETAESAG